MCAGVNAVISGPTIKGKKCCYAVCRGPIPPCGRPLTVAGDDHARVAPVVRSPGWSRSRAGLDAPDLPSETPALRTRLRDAWLADAAAEHASVASFARFALELLAVGAPAELVTMAHHAALDEIRHATECFTIAARYDAPLAAGASPFAPGPLSLEGVSMRSDLATVAAAAAEEACVGETFSAMALARASASCTDASLRDVLARLASDEARHAELGWCFVGWAVARGDVGVATAVTASFARALARFDASREDATDDRDDRDIRDIRDIREEDAWRAAGRLTDDDLRSVGRELHEVITATRKSLGLTSSEASKASEASEASEKSKG